MNGLSSLYCNITQAYFREFRVIHLSDKLGPGLSVSYNPREESIMTTHTSGQIRIFSNFVKAEDKVNDYREHWHTTGQNLIDTKLSRGRGQIPEMIHVCE